MGKATTKKNKEYDTNETNEKMLTDNDITYTSNEINELTDKYDETLLTHSLTVLLCDAFGQTIKILGKKNNTQTQRIYKIIRNTYHEHLEDRKYDTYFGKTQKEVTEVLDYIAGHPDIFRKDINESDVLALWEDEDEGHNGTDNDTDDADNTRNILSLNDTDADIDDILQTIENWEL